MELISPSLGRNDFRSVKHMRKLRTIEMNRLSIDEYHVAEKLPLVVVLDDVRSLYNVGSVFRTADAFRLTGLCLCGITATPPHNEIHKTALGAEDSVDWQYFASALEAVTTLQGKGYKVLLVDLDAQANLTYTMGASSEGATILEVITGEIRIHESIRHSQLCDIIPSSKALAGADAFLTDTGKEYRLREALNELRGIYDFVIVDTPPALGILTVNALTACDSVIIPAQADIYSLQGIEQLTKTIATVRKYCNPALRIEGILLTRYSSRSVLSREIADISDQLANKLGTKLFKTRIREAIAVKEAQLNQKSLFEYSPKAGVTIDYSAFIDEILEEK